MTVATQKKQLINWLLTIEDQSILNEIEKIKQQKKFNFEEEFEKGITANELKARTTQFLNSLPWKKQ